MNVEWERSVGKKVEVHIIVQQLLSSLSLTQEFASSYSPCAHPHYDDMHIYQPSNINDREPSTRSNPMVKFALKIFDSFVISLFPLKFMLGLGTP